MGSGSWSTAGYTATTARKVSTGTTFGYDTYAKRTGSYTAHESLDPSKAKPADGPFAGLVMRESRDSDEHPNSTPIIVGFDSTGSMGHIPRTVQKKLTTLFGLLVEKNYAPDPQVCVSTYGDAWVDRVPLQVAQFESDNRIDDNLDNMYLEGGGGGNGGETASALLYFAAHHTNTDKWEKRGEKGYIFLIADEIMLDLSKSQINELIGQNPVGKQEPGDLTVKGIARDVSEKWEVIILMIDNSAAKYQSSFKHYSELFGATNVLIVENPDTIAETIAAAVGVLEGRDASTVADDLVSTGASREVAVRASNLVTPLKKMGSSKVKLMASTGASASRF